MLEIVLFIIITYSTSNIIAHSGIFQPFRGRIENLLGEESRTYELFTCMMCLPTWVGFFYSLLFILLGYGSLSPFYSSGVDIIALAVFLDGVLGSGTTWLIHTFQEFMEADDE